MLKIKYNCFALPPYNIKLSKEYSLDKDSKGYFCVIGKDKKYLPIEEIKQLFSPIDDTWENTLLKLQGEKTEVNIKIKNK